jgi:cysteine-rich repeat protein
LLVLAAVAALAAASPAPAAPPPYPVLFVHGLTGSAARTWTEALQFFESQAGWGPAAIVTADDASTTAGHLYALNFSDFDQPYPSQNLSFAEQGGELAGVIAVILAANAGRTRVIVAAHSMGGVASRNYLEGLAEIGGQSVGYGADVAGLITVGTPHKGTELADTCTDLPFLCDPVVGAFGTPLDLDSVAMHSLRTDSAEIAALNAPASIAALPADVVYWSVVGAGQSVPVLLEADSDRVVPTSSQDLAGISGTEALNLISVTLDYSYLDASGGIGHLAESSDPRFFQEVLALVDALSVCGNGVAEGSETCDDANTLEADGCSPICSLEQCGDPVGNATPAYSSTTLATPPSLVTASDALFVLQAAVGGASCAACICDVNDNGSVTASDALAVLQSAVGTPGLLACAAC